MTYIKKFTDLCALFCSFVMTSYLIRKFMSFIYTEQEGIIAKARAFLSPTHYIDYRFCLLLMLAFAVSGMLGLILKRWPAPCLAVSLVPLCLSLYALEGALVEERPFLYIVLGLLHVLGNLFDALRQDREDGRRRAYLAANLLSGMLPLLTLCVHLRTRAVTALSVEAQEALRHFDAHVLRTAECEDASLILRLSLMIAGCLLISLLLRDIYFVDVITATVPAVYAIYAVFAERLTLFPIAVLILCVLHLFCRILLMTSEPMATGKGYRFRRAKTQ